MTHLRSLLFGFLVVALLPTGRVAVRQGRRAEWACGGCTTDGARFVARRPSLPHHLLPGQTCGTDNALLPVQAELTAPVATKASLPRALQRGVGCAGGYGDATTTPDGLSSRPGRPAPFPNRKDIPCLPDVCSSRRRPLRRWPPVSAPDPGPVEPPKPDWPPLPPFTARFT